MHLGMGPFAGNEYSCFYTDGFQQTGKSLSIGSHLAAAGISDPCIAVNFYLK